MAFSCKGRDEREASKSHNKSNSGGVGIIGMHFFVYSPGR